MVVNLQLHHDGASKRSFEQHPLFLEDNMPLSKNMKKGGLN